jgi:hypothetical protein
MTHKKTVKIMTLIAIVTVCFFPFVFSSGCMFDPGTVTTVSDSTTYRVSGKVYTSESKFLAGIHVSLFDSVNSIPSSTSITDTNGSFSISFPYIKQKLLFIKFIVPSSLSALYSSKRDTIHFDDKYGYTKYHETIMQSK